MSLLEAVRAPRGEKQSNSVERLAPHPSNPASFIGGDQWLITTQIEVKGESTHVFAHRFVLKTGSETVLADLTRCGLEKVNVRVGDHVVIEGERSSTSHKSGGGRWISSYW